MSIHDKYLFQFTRPQEARRQGVFTIDTSGRFNSRARKRRDKAAR